MNKSNPAVQIDKSIHMLIVDDDSNFLDAARRLLERLGYIVTSAGNRKEAITLLKEYNDVFDIIITDYSMPGTNGIQLAAEVNKLTLGTPIILYTGRLEPFDEKQIAKAGIAEVVRKPLKIKDLDIAIKRVLKENEEDNRHS